MTNKTNYDILKEYEAHKTPVPSYDEWKEKLKSLKVLAEEYCKEKKQNAQLKELLRKARYCLLDGCDEEDGISLVEAIDEVLR